MNYQETLTYLYESTPMFQKIGGKAYKEGLENTQMLDEYFKHPHQNFKTIHIAGTNGKGSCSHTLAAILQAAGYTVGLYTSPHLIDFRERIRINGEMVSEEYVVQFVENHRSFFEPLSPSFFELTTAMAFRYFADQKVDVAIIEVGLGGRLDCTNIISPDLSIITNISFDHMQFLGNTLPEIALEKAGIMKPHTPVVIGEATDELRDVFLKKAKAVDAPILFAEDSYPELKIETILPKSSQATSSKGTYTHFTIEEGGQMRFEALGELAGEYQQKNGRTIFTAAQELKKMGYQINDEHLKYGLEHVTEMTHIMGRWQVLGHTPTIVCDTGHNKAGLSSIVTQLNDLKENGGYQQLHFIIGMMRDKDVDSVLHLLPSYATFYFTQASVDRTLKACELKESAALLGLKGEAYLSVSDAFKAAKEKSLPEDLIFIGGSNFIVADLLASSDTFDLH